MAANQLPQLQFTIVNLMPVVVQPLGTVDVPDWAVEEARKLGGEEFARIPSTVRGWLVYSGRTGDHIGYILKHRRTYWPLYFSTEWNDYCLTYEGPRLLHALNYLVTAWRGVIRRGDAWVRQISRISGERTCLEDELADMKLRLDDLRDQLSRIENPAIRRLREEHIGALEDEMNETRAELDQLEDEPPSPRAGRPLGLNRIWSRWEGRPGEQITDEQPLRRLRLTTG